jgi:hypothetical protein
MDDDLRNVEHLLGSLPLKKPPLGLHARALRPVGIMALPIAAVVLVATVGVWLANRPGHGETPSQNVGQMSSGTEPTAQSPAALPGASATPGAWGYARSPFTITVTSPQGPEVFRWPPDLRETLKGVPNQVHEQITAQIAQIGTEDKVLAWRLQNLANDIRELTVTAIDTHRNDDGPEGLLAELPVEVQKRAQLAIEQMGTQDKSLKAALDRLPGEIHRLVESAIRWTLANANATGRFDTLPPEVKSRVLDEIARKKEALLGPVRKGVVSASRITTFVGGLKLEFRVQAGRKWLSASDKEGQVLYDGPVEPGNEDPRLSTQIQSTVEKLDKMMFIEGEALGLRPADGNESLKAEQIEIRIGGEKGH